MLEGDIFKAPCCYTNVQCLKGSELILKKSKQKYRHFNNNKKESDITQCIFKDYGFHIFVFGYIKQ